MSDGRGPSVLIADAQPTLRSSVRRVLEGEGFVVIGEADTAGEAVEAAARGRPDLCVLDALIPGGGTWAIAAITARSPDTATVVLTASQDQELLLDAIRAGAAGYLLKDMNPDRIPNALRGVLEGEAAIPRKLVGALLSDFQSQGRRRLLVRGSGRVELTRREWEVAQMLAEGATTQAIAERLFLSPVTIRRHVSEIVRKLGVGSRQEAIKLLTREFGGPHRTAG